MTRFTVLPDAAAVAEATADRFVAAARSAIDARGVFRVALSGGSTPKGVYPLLLEQARRDAVDWNRSRVLLGRRARRPAGPPRLELRRRVPGTHRTAAGRAARPHPSHAGRGARHRRRSALARKRAAPRLRGAGQRSAGLRPHLAGDGLRRPHRQPVSRHACPRGGRALGRRQLGAVARSLAHDADLSGAQRRPPRGRSSSPVRDKADALRAIRAGGSGLPAEEVTRPRRAYGSWMPQPRASRSPPDR